MKQDVFKYGNVGGIAMENILEVRIIRMLVQRLVYVFNAFIGLLLS